MVGSAFAQESDEKVFPNSGEVEMHQTDPEGRSTVTNILESTVIEDKYVNQYQKSNIQNISQLYWLKEVLDLANDKAIDNFVMINECEFYKKYYTSDFKWGKIRETVRATLAEKKENFSDKFKIIIPIDLGRYDVKKQGFPVINDSAISDMRRVEVGGNEERICGESFEIEFYPRSVFLILSEPFNYKFVPIDEHLAQAYIIRSNEVFGNRPRELRGKAFDRLAYARIRMSFSEYQSNIKQRYRADAAVMYGKIDGIDVFENADETGLLSTQDF